MPVSQQAKAARQVEFAEGSASRGNSPCLDCTCWQLAESASLFSHAGKQLYSLSASASPFAHVLNRVGWANQRPRRTAAAALACCFTPLSGWAILFPCCTLPLPSLRLFTLLATYLLYGSRCPLSIHTGSARVVLLRCQSFRFPKMASQAASTVAAALAAIASIRNHCGPSISDDPMRTVAMAEREETRRLNRNAMRLL